MSAAGRFVRSMALAAMTAVVVEHKKHAAVAAMAARNGLHLTGTAWAGITVALGVGLFILWSLVAGGRGESQRSRSGGSDPAPARSGRRSGRR